MEFNFDDLPARERYALLTAVVVPRPIALVTTVDAGGRLNAAPFSFFNAMGSDPPVVVLGIGDRERGVPKDTAANIRATGEFVVNIVVEAIAEQMNLTATDFPAGLNELTAVGLTTVPSVRVRPPRVAESPVNLECRELSTIEFGRNRIIVGQVLHLHANDDLLDSRGRVKPGALHAIGRMQSPGAYTRTRDQFHLDRLTYEQFLNRGT
jgi:flavin reductase (DIM6/NTAB) family NADH-FMN oxidoreductase RutF